MVVSIICLPLLASIITGLFNKFMSKQCASVIAAGSMIFAALISIYVFSAVGISGKIIHIKLFHWLSLGSFNADFAIYIDQLSSIMLLVVTLVSAVVHVYSIGYMHEDENLPRFMSYLSLFTVCMMLLVTSDNFLQLFFGWEGVGLCSYLLIGFWYEKQSANMAATKAFIVNRIGDFAFILGIILIFLNFNSVEFINVFNSVEQISETKFCASEHRLIEVICLLLFIGAMGKSAQIGLHIWLPDAMEGPTPVSALIHAATMVTAGVFLLARCSFLFEYANYVRDMIIVIGSLTCLFAALIALCQTDIKKIIAYSTCSQLGYMFIACGLSVYHAGIFHLYTHAFFKAMLFLCAGSVIHATGEQEITKMGGLKSKMPITYALFWVGSLAIMGIFPLSGFYSKDLILNSALLTSNSLGMFAYKSGIIAALCTAIYSTKIIIKVFHGAPSCVRKKKDLEAPTIMNAPLIMLVVGTIFAGFFASEFLNIEEASTGYFKNTIFIKEYIMREHLPFIVEIAPSLVALAGMLIGYIIFSTDFSYRIAKIFKPLYLLVLNKFYFDEIYNCIFVKTSDSIACFSGWFDRHIIDYCSSKITSGISLYSSRRLSLFHNGLVNFYAFMMLFGMVCMLSFLVFKYVL